MNLSASLLAWYKQFGRDLPWRHTRRAYLILVSEIMLQQTQVSRGLIFYPRFLKRFPSWDALASASNADVIETWAGLGYNRRALMLRDIAKQIVERGHIPKNAAEWQTLKGIGPYTAAALACFSLNERILPIDTNIRRVLGRVLLGEPFPQPEQDALIQEKRARIFPKTQFQDIPQAIFDLATTICTKSPHCAECPFKNACPCASGFLAGTYNIPKQMVKKANETKHRNKPHPDRIYRGRILKYIRENANVKADARLGKAIDPDFIAKKDLVWLKRMVERLVKDRLLKVQHGTIEVG